MWIRRLLGALLAFGALNAFAGGYCGLSGAEGVPREWLAGTPFTDYVLPSAILFVVAGATTWRRTIDRSDPHRAKSLTS